MLRFSRFSLYIYFILKTTTNGRFWWIETAHALRSKTPIMRVLHGSGWCATGSSQSGANAACNPPSVELWVCCWNVWEMSSGLISRYYWLKCSSYVRSCICARRSPRNRVRIWRFRMGGVIYIEKLHVSVPYNRVRISCRNPGRCHPTAQTPGPVAGTGTGTG